MKDNYSWLDSGLSGFAAYVLDYPNEFSFIKERQNELKQTIISQVEIEKLRARIETVNTILLFDSDKAHSAKEILQAENDYITKLLADLTEKLKELENQPKQEDR